MLPAWLRYTLLMILACTGVILGYLRWTYVLIWDGGIHFVMRHTLYEKYSYPQDLPGLLESMAHDPRWLSAMFYFLAPFALSVSSVYLFFQRRIYVINTVVIYLFAWGLLVFLSVLSFITPSYAVGIGLAQDFKNLLQTPFFTLLIIAGFKVKAMMPEKEQ